jgi:MFS family permease
MGAPFWGWLSDALKRRKPIMLWGTVVALVSLMVVLYCPLYQVKIISIILFLFGFGASGFFTSFAMIREVFPIALAATVLGFMNTFDSICEAFSEPLVGAVLDWTWQGAIAHNIHQFSTRGYQLSLSLLPLYLVAALVILYFIQETYCQTREVAE